MTWIKVKNKKGTGSKLRRDPPNGYLSWLNFWEQRRGNIAEECTARGCYEKVGLEGGHVFIPEEGNKEYIVPICARCNNMPDDEVFEVWESELIPVRQDIEPVN